MSWLELDDGILDHPKFIRAVKLAESYAVHLWLGIRAYCGKHLTDGFIPGDMIDEVRGPREPKKRAAALNALVEVNLIERVDGGFAMHDFLDWSKSRAQVEEQRAHGAIRSALRSNTKLMREIRERDGNRCRYCACAVDWRDRRGPRGGTYDHVIPLSKGGGAGIDNVVVACRQCNLSKHDKLLTEWGRPLLPVDYQVTTSSDLSTVLVSRARACGEGSGSDLDPGSQEGSTRGEEELPERQPNDPRPALYELPAGPITSYGLTKLFGAIRSRDVGGLEWQGVRVGGGRDSSMADMLNADPTARADVAATMALLFKRAKAGRAGPRSAELITEPSLAFAAWCSSWTSLREELHGTGPKVSAPPPDERCAYHQRGGRGKLPNYPRDNCPECKHARAATGGRTGEPTPVADALVIAADRKSAELRAAAAKTWTPEQQAEMREALQRDRQPAKAIAG